MDRRIKFRHLDAFSAIARAHSFKRAAEALHLSQPAMSRTMKELEDILGTSLLDRSRAGVALTPEGEVFLQFAEQSTAALRHGLRSLRAGDPASTTLRVGALPSVAASLLPPVVMTFAARHPSTQIEIHEGPHHDLTARLRAGGLDMVIGRLGDPDKMTGLTFQQMYAEAVVIVARPDSAALELRDLAGCAAFRVLYPPQDSAIRPLVARLLTTQGVALFADRIETASSAFGRAVTLADPRTIWFISRGVVAQDIAARQLALVPLDLSATHGAVGIMTRADEVPSTATRQFAHLLAAATG